MKRLLFALTLLLIPASLLFADNSNLKAKVVFKNPSADINDGIARIIVNGGTTPYKYKWPIHKVPLTSDSASGLTEGITYKVKITDAKGQSTWVSFKIPARSINEKINATFVPVVNFMDKFLMFDPFAALHLYNPIIHDKNGHVVRYPNGDPVKRKIPFIVLWLIFGAIYFTFRMKFVNITKFKLALELTAGKYDDGKESGEVSHFQALSTALSSTVGLGNIAGVAIAITIGGPGATFWMILAGLLGMSTKFMECTLGVKYRDIDKNGIVAGGPMYYMEKGLAEKGMAKLGKFLAVLFAILILIGSFGIGNMFQANQSFSQFAHMIPALKDYGVVFGIFLAILVGLVVIGGIKSIARVADKIVPFMAVFYVATALVIIFMNINHTGEAFKLIWQGAFHPDALKGGIIGVMITGFRRAAFSNEAGIGSAPTAHSAVRTNYPVTEGLVALLEPFIDTVIICTMTALVIIYTGMYNVQGLDGVTLTSKAFASVFPWFPYLLTISVFLFAFSTMLGWSYYGYNGFKYLFRNKIKSEKVMKGIFYSFYLFFIVVGAATSLGAIVDFSDMMILTMALPNIFTLYILQNEVDKELKDFLHKIKTGEVKKISRKKRKAANK